MTLACEDDNSKLVEVVSVAHVDDEKRVGNSLVQILKLIFMLDFELKFGHYFAADVWLWLLSSILVEILKLGLVKIFSLSFVKMLMLG